MLNKLKRKAIIPIYNLQFIFPNALILPKRNTFGLTEPGIKSSVSTTFKTFYHNPYFISPFQVSYSSLEEFHFKYVQQFFSLHQWLTIQSQFLSSGPEYISENLFTLKLLYTATLSIIYSVLTIIPGLEQRVPEYYRINF